MVAIDLANRYFMPSIEWFVYAFALHKTLGQGKRKPVAGVLLYFLIAGITIISYYLSPPGMYALSVIIIASLTFITHLIYRAPLHIAAVFCISVYYISVLSDLFLGNLIMSTVPGDINTMLSHDPQTRFTFSLTAKILQFALSTLLIKGFRRISWNIPTVYWYVLDAVIIFYFIIAISFSMVNSYLQIIVPPGAITFLVALYIAVNVMTLGLFSTISTHYIRSQLEYISRITKSRLDTEILMFESEKVELNKTKHDFKNTLSNIALLIREGAKIDALDYIKNYTVTLPEAQMAKYTGISSIDSMISLKVAVAETQEISLAVNAEALPAEPLSVLP